VTVIGESVVELARQWQERRYVARGRGEERSDL